MVLVVMLVVAEADAVVLGLSVVVYLHSCEVDTPADVYVEAIADVVAESIPSYTYPLVVAVQTHQ